MKKAIIATDEIVIQTKEIRKTSKGVEVKIIHRDETEEWIPEIELTDVVQIRDITPRKSAWDAAYEFVALHIEIMDARKIDDAEIEKWWEESKPKYSRHAEIRIQDIVAQVHNLTKL